MFKVGDTVICLTDKYKLVDKNSTYIIKSLGPNDFISLTHNNRNYKTKYFRHITKRESQKSEKKWEESPMGTNTWKNPFKFTSMKPSWEELWSKIKSTYSHNIDEFNVETVRIYTFFYLASAKNWDTQKTALLDKKSFTNMLKNEHLTLSTVGTTEYKNLIKYKDYIIRNVIIPDVLFFTFIASNFGKAHYDVLFGIPLSEIEAKEIDRDSTESNTFKILHKTKILKEFTKYIKIDPTRSAQYVKTKAELKESIFTHILEGHKYCSEYTTIKGSNNDSSL